MDFSASDSSHLPPDQREAYQLIEARKLLREGVPSIKTDRVGHHERQVALQENEARLRVLLPPQTMPYTE